MPEARAAYKAEKQGQVKLDARTRNINKQLRQLKADAEKYGGLAASHSEKALKAMESNGGTGNASSSSYGRSSTRYREKAAEANNKIRSLKDELQTISQELHSPEMNMAKAAYDEAEAKAQKARSELIDVKALFDAMNTKLESAFGGDPVTVRLGEELELAKAHAEATRKHAIENISDRRYSDLINKRDRLQAELRPQ